MQRSTTTRDKHRARIRRNSPECGICREPIDYSLPYLHPLSFVVDHIIPLNRGGKDILENKQAAHRGCNRAKSDKMPGEYNPAHCSPVALHYTTPRTWTA